jgi:hypothetical protein
MINQFKCYFMILWRLLRIPFKSVLWNTKVTIISFMQLIIYGIIAYFSASISFDKTQFYVQGVFLFFCSTLIASIILDCLYTNRKSLSTIFVIWGIVVIPSIIILLSLCIYLVCFFSNASKPILPRIQTAQNVIFISTLIYTVFIKSIMFYQQEKGGK